MSLTKFLNYEIVLSEKFDERQECVNEIKLADADADADFKGSQGYVKEIVLANGLRVMRKISSYVDYTVELEYDAMMCCSKLNLPHFCEAIKLSWDENINKFSVVTKKVLGKSLTTFLRNDDENVQGKLNIIYQVLAAMACTNLNIQLCHNDLHASNIIINQTIVDVHVYVFKLKTYAIETFGLCPVVIDFGFAYLPNKKMRIVPAFTDIGYFPFQFDSLIDARVITLDTLDALITNHLDIKNVLEHVLMIKRIWKNLHLDSMGHFKRNTFASICFELKQFMAAHVKTSSRMGVFDATKKDDFDEAISLVMAHIRLPLKRIRLGKIKKLFKKIGSSFFNEHKVTPFELVAKQAFNMLLYVWSETGKADESIDDQLFFIKALLDDTSEKSIANKFLNVKYVVELKQCLSLMTMVVNNFVYNVSKKMMEHKRKLYDRLPVRNVLDVLNLLPVQPVEFKLGMKVAVFNCQTLTRSYKKLTTPADVIQFNELYSN